MVTKLLSILRYLNIKSMPGEPSLAIDIHLHCRNSLFSTIQVHIKNGASSSGAYINMTSMRQVTSIWETLQLVFNHNIDLEHSLLFWHLLLWPWVSSRLFKVVVERDIFLVPVYHSPTKLFIPVKWKKKDCKLNGLCSKVVSHLHNKNIKSLSVKNYRTMWGLHAVHSTTAH